ncbi:MAG: TlpA disulfide reductase family protein [Bacteroidetes bacterium]|nr:TlpA disulfide reductase family protein [Bacteroidota bacterium]
MKITSLVASSFLFVGVSFFLLNCSNVDSKKKDYLQTVLNNLNKIKSATYYTTTESWAPGDTSASGVYYHYVKEFDNRSDTTIGASFVELLQEDTTHMTFCYDGMMRAIVYEDEKTIAIDSFQVPLLPFRPVTSPFFNYTKNIIKYALETTDSVLLEQKDLKDSYYFSLTIFEDHQIEFFGKAYYVESTSYDSGETTSKYELWINKSTDLPYRVRREMSHDIIVITCRSLKINNIKIEDFRASDYFEPGYTIETFGHGSNSEKVNDLTGKVAPDWILKDANDNTVALKDLKSKILMIQFTSVSCGPCRASIPFLKQLASEYNQKNFDFVAIESWTKNSNVLKSYQGRNKFNYKFLMSTKDVTRSYQIKSVPVFFILDKNRVIKKVINGYGEGSTDKEIRDAINDLI